MSEHDNPEVIFQIQRIYTKDVSFEAPSSPLIFQYEWDPDVKLDIDSSSNKLADNLYEVVLRTTVTAKVKEETAFLCEVQQAGIFVVAGFDDAQLAHCFGAYCPNILFPYIRECISNLVNRGTFPPLNLAPVNFDALYMSHLQQHLAQQSGQPQDA